MNAAIINLIIIIIFISIALAFLAILGFRLYFWRLSLGWKRLLKQYQAYSGAPASDGSLPEFSYSTASDPELIALRQQYTLEAIAAGKSEIERIVALMKWVHGLSKHAPSPEIIPPLNSIGLFQNYVEKKKGMDCKMHAIILNEAYLALGFQSRMVHLRPYDSACKSSHYVVIVFSKTANKWIMMDADICGYLRDEYGNYLGLAEIRDRLANGGKLVVNNDTDGVTKILGRWSYPAYLSKNLFRFNCSQMSGYGQEDKREGDLYWALVPAGFEGSESELDVSDKSGAIMKRISDPTAFWRLPEQIDN